MADAIPAWQISSFSTTVEHRLQQMGGLLRPTMSFHGGYVGKKASPVNFLGPTKAQKITTRLAPSPTMSVDHQRRWVAPTGYEWGDLIESDDPLFTNIGPAGKYTEAGIKAMQRSEDEEILASFFATAVTGEEGNTTEAWADGTANVGYYVAENFTGDGVTPANAGLTVQKLIKARELFAKYYVDLDQEELWMLITEQEYADLFTSTSNITISGDYVSGKPTETGRLGKIHGFNFVQMSSQAIDAIPGMKTGNVRSLPVWCKSGMHVGLWKERDVKIAPDPSFKFKPRIYMNQYIGATRLQMGKVLKIKTYRA